MAINLEDLIGKDVKTILNERERAKKFKELKEFLKEETNNRKSGNAETVRLAVDMAHDELESLREEEKQQKTQLRKIIDYKNEIIRRLE